MKSTRWTVRTRLTALYAGAFLAAGIVLVAVTYWLVSRSLQRPSGHEPSDGADQIQHDTIAAYRADTLSNLLTWSLIAVVVTLVVAVVLGWLLAGRALRPLRQVTETANRVAGQSLHERIALDGPRDEVKELADTIDAMLERLDRSFGAQRRFVANASHELRTPLAVNRTLLEVALGAPDVSADLERLAPTLLATNERSERLIEGLLMLASAEYEVTERTAIDLADLASAAVELEQASADQRGLTMITDLQPAPVAGNSVLVEQLVVNLVQNAVRHSPPDADVIVRTGSRDGNSAVQVENPGAALRQHEIEPLFEPFRRADGRTASSGVGLGLSIVRSVALAHGGQVAAQPRQGGGLQVRVELPAT